MTLGQVALQVTDFGGGDTGRSLLEGGLRVGYIWQNGKYEAALYSRNIANQIRVVGGIDFNNLTGFINEPRIFGAQLRMNF